MKKLLPIFLVLFGHRNIRFTQATLAQDKYPQTVEIIVSWAAGGATDVLFRALGAVFPRYANNQQMMSRIFRAAGRHRATPKR